MVAAGTARKRSNKLDSLRGIAALVVVFHHGLYIFDHDAATRVRMPRLQELGAYDLILRAIASVALGEIAVFVFFVLSGAVLMESLRREPVIGLDAALRFTGRRIFRIFPAMIVAIVAFAVLTRIHLPAYLPQPFSIEDVVRNSLMIDHGVLGITWSLRTEMLMVPVLLALAWLRGSLGTIVLVAFLSLSQYYLSHGVPVFGYLLLHALMAFALGALATTDMARDACRAVPRAALWGLLAALVVIRFVAPLSSIGAVFVMLWIAAAIVALLYHDPDPDHPFERPGLVFLGRVSYGVYLLHWIVIYWPFAAFQWLFGADRIAADLVPFYLLYMLLFVVPVTIALAVPLERYVELPFIRMGHALFPSGRPAASTGAVAQARPGMRGFLLRPVRLEGREAAETRRPRS